MIKRFFLLLIMSSVMFACEKEKETDAKPYEGQWDLVYFSKGSDIEIYQPEDIQWEFNKFDELIVNINTAIPNNSQLPIKTSGVYNYVGSADVISLENTQYAVEIKNDTLYLSHNATTGGPLLKLVASK